MDNYTPTIEQVRQAHKIYDEVILTLVLNPKKIVEAYRLLTNCTDVLVNQKYAHRYVHAYFYYKKYLVIYPNYNYEKEDEKSIDNSVDNTTGNDNTVDNNNHNDNTVDSNKLITDSIDVMDFAFSLPEEQTEEIESDEELILINRIAELEKELQLALTSDDWKLIKNTRMKITKAKNKLSRLTNNSN